LSTSIIVKVAEISHHSQVKSASFAWECISDPHYTRSPFGTPVPFPDRALFPKRQLETMDEMSALLWSLQKLISLCMAEA
jgi:hypothetical protein